MPKRKIPPVPFNELIREEDGEYRFSDSLFMWQDMLRGQCMLLSLKTQRFVGIDPATGEPYAADWAGAHPDRSDGTVLTWREVGGE